MDEKVSMDQSGQTGGFFTRLKKLSFRPRLLTSQSNTPPRLAEFKDGKTESMFPKRQLCRRFSIAEICSATRNFNKSLLIGTGGFGDMYKGTLKNGTRTDVAVKRRLSKSFQGNKQFLAEVEILPMLQHPNIVRLIGYCDDDNEMILVYEYTLNETLEHHLHKHNTRVSWLQRLKICIDVAHGLDYLHNGWRSEQGVIHGDIKSSNILLDNQWAAKISDFGLSIITPSGYNPSSPVTKSFRGTMGYLDPEYMETGRVSMKSDVYSFGVVLLEVLCRKRAYDINHIIEHGPLVKWAVECLRNGELDQIIDPDLKGQISFKGLNDYAKILECCLRERQRERATMAEVVIGLESILALQERTDYSNTQAGITISDYRLQKYFFSTEQNAGTAEPAQAPSGSNTQPPPGINNSLRGIKLLSVESRQPKEDLGHMSDSISEIDAVSEMSYQLDGLSDVFHEEFMSRYRTESLNDIRNKTESLYDMMQLDYIQQAGMLTRMKDFLHLIWFYPMKKEADINLASLVDKFSSLNNYIRKSQDSSTDGYYLLEIQTLIKDVEELLDDAAFDMVAYLPEGLTETTFGEVSSASFWSGVPEIHSSTIVSARDQALRCIKDLKVKIIGISGADALKVADALNDLPELQSVFDMVLFVRVKRHSSIEELLNDIEEEINLFKRRSSETGNIIDFSDTFLNCLLFIDCSEDFINLHEIELHLYKWFQNMQIVMTSGGGQDAYSRVDLEIRIDYHLLPWILFSTNVDLTILSTNVVLTIVGPYSRIQQMATRAVEQCHGHLLAIILLAKALKGVVDISVWELALEELASHHKLSSSLFGPTSDVMVKVLRFVWSRMETVAQKCIIQYALLYIRTDLEKPSLIHSWVRNGLVKSEQEGERVLEDLVCSFLLEYVGGDCVRMRDETRVVLVSHFVPRAHGFHLKQDGSKSNKMPNIEEWDDREIHLTNNMLSELPDNPKCPILVKLFLHSNQDLMDIPVMFFDNMPTLQVLDLSSTSIKCLPSSIAKLTTLRELFIRNCDLMMELPPEIGALKNLKVFDSEGTQLIGIPEQFGSLTKLECLRCSLYKFSDTYKQSSRNMSLIPVVDLSKLVRLKELSICVKSNTEWWENEVKVIIDIFSKLRNLESLRLYIPTTELLHIFMEKQNWEGVPIYQHLSNFCIIVGHNQQRVISRLPLDLDETFLKLPKCLKYANGEGNTQVVARALKHANALFLDRHWTIQSMSTFGLEEMDKLKFCLLVECNEMLEIFNIKDFFFRPVLESLEYLSVHSMRSLSCIWNGPIHGVSLSNLKTLVIHACPELTTVLTYGLLGNLTRLENFIVEDCLMICSLVDLGSYDSTSSLFLPSLKKISLVHLPALISISCGISIAPRLESLVVYDCPNLEKLSSMEVSDQIKEIKGENEWWDGLQWCEPEWTSGQPDYLAKVFTPLGTDGDIMDELAEAANFLPLSSD